MDMSQIAFFKERYREMSEDELVYLLAAKRDSLTEEAAEALSIVVRERRIPHVEREVAATQLDLRVQAELEAEAERRRRERKAAERKFVLWLCASGVVVGAGLAILRGVETGVAVMGTAVAAALFYEIRRLFGKFVAAMFRMS